MFAFKKVDTIIKLHERLGQVLRDDIVIEDIHRLYSSLNAKSAALFQHTSIMIAACMLLANLNGTQHAVRIVFLAESFVYLIICVTLLPVLNISMYDVPDSRDKWREYFARSIRRRSLFHSLSLHLTIFLTLIVVATLAVDLYYFGDPFTKS